MCTAAAYACVLRHVGMVYDGTVVFCCWHLCFGLASHSHIRRYAQLGTRTITSDGVVNDDLARFVIIWCLACMCNNKRM